MLIETEDEQHKFGQPLKLDLEDKEGVSILQQPLNDTQGIPYCYLYEGCWIELNLIPEISSPEKKGNNQLWQAIIYFGTSNKTALAVGAYTNRLQAALKAEQLITKSKVFENKAVA